MVNTLARGQLLRLDVPVGTGLVIDAVGSAELPGLGELRVVTGGRDDTRAGQPGELEGEDRDASRPLGQHRVSRFDPSAHNERLPGCHSGARKRRSFLEAEVRRYANQSLLE